MISLYILFWIFIVLFAMIGAIRKWAKELLVASAVVVAIFVITILESFIPVFRDTFQGDAQFWMRILIVGALTFFGYQGPKMPRLAGSERFVRDRLQDTLLGIIIGGFNGYMVFGTIWFYLHQAGYPFTWISAPDQLSEAGQKAIALIDGLPPALLQTPLIYIAVAAAFIIILVVFI